MDVAGDPAPMQAVAGVVAAGKENLVEDAAAIAAKSKELYPMLKRAKAILAQRQESRANQPYQNGDIFLAASDTLNVFMLAYMELTQPDCAAATLAEKEIAARRAAINIPTDDLRRIRECILAD